MAWPRWSELALAIAALVAAGAIGFAAGAARGGSATGKLTVSAQGTVQVAPQIVDVRVAADEVAPTAQGALGKLTAAAKAVLAAVAKNGVAAADVRTSNLNLGRHYTSGHPDGYQASEQFTLTVRKLSTVGRVITAATHAGANQVNGLSLRPADPNAGVQQAVAAALKTAGREASAEAKQLGVQVVRVANVQVQSSSPRPVVFASAARVPSPSVPIATGGQQVTVTVLVTYTVR